MVLPYINMNLPQVHTCSPSWNPLPPPSLYHPTGSSQCTSPKHPVSCIKPGLAISVLYHVHLAWNVPMVSPISLKRSLVFTTLLFSPISLHCSPKKSFLISLFFGTLHSDGYIVPFLLCLSLLSFSHLFVRPPKTLCLLAFLFLWVSFGPCFLYNIPPVVF